MAFPTIVSENSGTQTSNVTSHAINMPASIVSGNLLLVFFSNDDTTTATPSTGWTTLATEPGGVTGVARLSIFYKTAAGSDTLTVTTASAENSCHYSVQISGWTGTPEVAIDEDTATDDNPNPPSLTPSWGADDTLWYASEAEGNGGISITSHPTNYTAEADLDSAGGGGTHLGVSSRELNAASEDPGTYTLTGGTADWVAMTVAVQPAGAAVGPVLRQPLREAMKGLIVR